MDFFETKIVISENSMRELKLHLIAPSQKIIALFGVVFSIYAAITFESAAFCLLVIPFVLLIPYAIKQNIKVTIKRFQESTNMRECEITTSLGEDCLKCFNHSTNGISTFSYDSIKRFVITKNY